MRFLRTLILGLLLCVLPLELALGQGSFPFGDLNCDESVNVTDVQLSILSALGLPISATLDANGDGTPDACESNCTGLACGPGTLPNGEGTACVVDPAVLDTAFADGVASVDITVDNLESFNSGMQAMCGDAGGDWEEDTGCALTACLNGGVCDCSGTGFEGLQCEVPVPECVPEDCDDGLPCTLDGCDSAGNCTHTPDDSLCDDGTACTSEACVAGSCVYEVNSNQDALELLQATVSAVGHVKGLLQEMAKGADYASCGTASDLDRSQLQEAHEELLNGLTQVTSLTSFGGIFLLKGDGEGGSLEFPLPGSLIGPVMLTPKTPEVLLGSPLPAVDTWVGAMQARQSLKDAIAIVESDEVVLNAQWETLTNGCGIPPVPTTCQGLGAGSSPALCDNTGEGEELCLLTLMDTADAGLDTLEPLLGNLLALAMKSTCGAANDNDRAALNTQFQSKVQELNAAIAAVELGGVSILSEGVAHSFDLLGQGGDFAALAGETQVPAWGGAVLFDDNIPTISDQASAQLALTAINNAFLKVAEQRQSIRAQFNTYFHVFGCNSGYAPLEKGPPPTSWMEWLLAGDECGEDTTSLNIEALLGYSNLMNLLNDMRDLALSGASGNASAALDSTFQGLFDQIDVVAAGVQYNGFDLLGGGGFFGGTMIAFHAGSQNTVHNMNAHMYQSQSSVSLFGFSPPNVDTQVASQQALGAIDVAILTLKTDLAAVQSTTDVETTRKSVGDLYTPHDVTGPGEACALDGEGEECDDCALHNCRLLDTTLDAYGALLSILFKMNILAISSASDGLDLYEMSYNDTAFQDWIAQIDALSNVTEYNGLKPLLGDGSGGNLTLTSPSGETSIAFLLPSTESPYLFNNQYLGVEMESSAITANTAINEASLTLQNRVADLESIKLLFGCSP